MRNPVRDKAVAPMRVAMFSQDPNKLAREMVYEIGRRIGPCTFVAGMPDSYSDLHVPNVKYILAPSYKRQTIKSRMGSWIAYTFLAMIRILILLRKTDLFVFITSPPYIGVLGVLAKVLAKKKYVLIVNDIYPDIVENFGMIRRDSLTSRAWRRLNRVVYDQAKWIITISEEMGKEISEQVSAGPSTNKVIVIPTWVDTKRIKPILKDDNPFAIEYHQRDKITVLYAGNMGNAADVALLPKIAGFLEHDPRIHFLLVGRGEKAEYLKELIADSGIKNTMMLPYQPETVLPQMLATADISLVILNPHNKGKSAPSKTYYYMAAGSALVVICAEDDALERMIRKHHCGLSVHSGDEAARAIERFVDDKAFLDQCKGNSRKAAEMFFDKERCISQFIEALMR